MIILIAILVFIKELVGWYIRHRYKQTINEQHKLIEKQKRIIKSLYDSKSKLSNQL